MKKVLLPVILVSILVAGCQSDNSSNNTNLANAATPIVSNTETTPEIAAKPENTPLPVFTDANEAVSVGDQLFDRSDNAKAIEVYQQAVKLNPDFAEAYFKLGMAYSQLEIEQREAGVLTEEEPTPTPAKTKTKTKKGKKEIVALTDADKAFENSVKAYNKILDKNSKDDQALFNLGRAYNKLNEDTEAQKALNEAVKLQPENGQYQTELGAILIKLAKYEDAIPHLKKAVAIDADNLQAQDLLEKAQAGKKRIDFGIKPKLEELSQQQQQQELLQQQQQQQTKKQGKRKPKENPNSQTSPPQVTSPPK
jgi:tetratricopeptide (TPR) repeat protein